MTNKELITQEVGKSHQIYLAVNAFFHEVFNMTEVKLELWMSPEAFTCEIDL